MATFTISDEAPQKYTEDFIIRSYHVDVNRKLTIQKLCSFFQEVAGNHTEACGVGWEVMHQVSVFWVLSRLKIEVIKYPLWHEKITIKTWSNGLEGLSAVRNFQVVGENDEEYFRAISTWLMVNTKTRRLVKADDYMDNFPLCADRVIEKAPCKIHVLKDPHQLASAPVSYTETDMNQHMNNVSYIDRIVNTFDPIYLKDYQIKYFEINFQKEARPEEMIMVQKQQVAHNEFLHNIIQKESKKEMVRTRMVWEKI